MAQDHLPACLQDMFIPGACRSADLADDYLGQSSQGKFFLKTRVLRLELLKPADGPISGKVRGDVERRSPRSADQPQRGAEIPQALEALLHTFPGMASLRDFSQAIHGLVRQIGARKSI